MSAVTEVSPTSALQEPPVVPTAVLLFADREKLGIWRRIECIMAECKRLPKTETNKDQGFDYTPYDDIAEMVRPLMAQYGVAIVQEPVEFQREGTLTRVKYRYDVVNTDRSEDRIALHNYGEAADLSDKGINKASTVAEKFFLCRLFHISTGGDPDGTFIAVQRNGGQQHNGRENGRPYENGRNHDHRGRSGGAQSAARDSEEFRCEQCARAVIPARKDGEMVSVKSILAASQREYQKNLCADCLLAKRAQTNAGSAPSAIPSDPQVSTAPAEPQVSA